MQRSSASSVIEKVFPPCENRNAVDALLAKEINYCGANCIHIWRFWMFDHNILLETWICLFSIVLSLQVMSSILCSYEFLVNCRITLWKLPFIFFSLWANRITQNASQQQQITLSKSPLTAILVFDHDLITNGLCCLFHQSMQRQEYSQCTTKTPLWCLNRSFVTTKALGRHCSPTTLTWHFRNKFHGC